MRVIAGFLILWGLLLACAALTARAQNGPETDGNEIEVWTAGGHGTNGRTQHTSVWNLGFRYGWILTEARGPSVLRGRLEYAVDAVPAFLVFQPTDTAYGAAVSPVGLIWNFDTHGRVVPYIDLGGGVLFTNKQVPPGVSRINFTTDGAVGLRFLTRKASWNVDVRFLHISNASLADVNPGINTVELRLGLGWFTHPRR